ncbi:hypothetical protein SAMN05660350_04142 [Geodermatophilus obscurus]|uniref:Uncharacterized protein n=1 Tax=Geodermatophilus obscurus TaxID=1861 RepID=A0A1M7UWN9_9ACTN|nr:hypothetical protein SAMN05660350_04142 [Geodermatophilus obscurus]
MVLPVREAAPRRRGAAAAAAQGPSSMIMGSLQADAQVEGVSCGNDPMIDLRGRDGGVSVA